MDEDTLYQKGKKYWKQAHTMHILKCTNTRKRRPFL